MNDGKNNPLLILTVILALALSIETVYLITSRHKVKGGPIHSDLKRSPEASRPRRWQQSGPSLSFFNQAAGSLDPFEEMERIQARMNQMFRDSFSRSMIAGPNFDLLEKSTFFEPDIDMSETGTQYIIKLDLPGMEKDKINVEIANRMLIISGERKLENEETKEGSFYRMERSFGSFEKTIPLPDNADADTVKSDYKNGVMTLTIDKLASSKMTSIQGKKVEIR